MIGAGQSRPLNIIISIQGGENHYIRLQVLTKFSSANIFLYHAKTFVDTDDMNNDGMRRLIKNREG